MAYSTQFDLNKLQIAFSKSCDVKIIICFVCFANLFTSKQALCGNIWISSRYLQGYFNFLPTGIRTYFMQNMCGVTWLYRFYRDFSAKKNYELI